MRKFQLVVGLLAGSLTSFAQVDFYKIYNIRNASGEVISAINEELKTAHKDNFERLLLQKQNANPITSKTDLDSFIGAFNMTLDKTKHQFQAQELMWKTGKEIGKYGLEVMSNYAEVLPSKHLKNFLAPAIQQGFELYIDNEINEGIHKHQQDIDALIRNRINLLYSNGVDVSTAADARAFEAMFALAHADLPALDRDEFGTFNKELTKYAYEFLQKNRDQIKLVDQRLTQQYDQLKQDVTLKHGALQKQITGEVNTKLQDLGNSIIKLSNNQEEIFSTLDIIKERISTNEKRIGIIEKSILKLGNDIEGIKSLQAEHSKLLNKNSFQLDILSKYTFQNLNTSQKIAALEKGEFDYIFSPVEKIKLKDELYKIQTKETIISVASAAEKFSGGTYSAMVGAGILKGKDAENVGKLMHAVSIVSGAARVYAGDYSGIASIASGITGLTAKPKKSAELQMMEAMLDYMKVRFDRIEGQLNRIDAKIDTLSVAVYRMHKSMALSFQYTNEQLQRIDWKINVLNRKATTQLYQDYAACKALLDTWNRTGIIFRRYEDYVQRYDALCHQCLIALNNFTIDPIDDSYFLVESNQQLKSEQFIEREINDEYNPTKDLFSIYYGRNSNMALHALMFPVRYTRDTNKPLFFISGATDLAQLNSNDVLKQYYNYEMMDEATTILLKFLPYFEFAGNGSSFKPARLSRYLENNTQSAINKDIIRKRLTKLSRIIQYTIIQQSFMSGNLLLDPMYATLFGYSTDANGAEKAIQVLKNNNLIATNFGTYLVNRNLELGDGKKMQGLFERAVNNSQSLDTLNALIRVDDIRFTAIPNQGKLALTFARGSHTVSLRLTDFYILAQNEMVNSESLFTLLQSLEAVRSKLVDLTFTENIANDEQLIERFKYNYSELESDK